MSARDLFAHIARETARHMGHPLAFLAAVAVVIIWAILGPLFGFSDTWQLVINTATTIITFLMVFLIQNTQNRDSDAIHLKLDELLRVTRDARTGLVDLEDCSEEELIRLKREFETLQRREQVKPLDEASKRKQPASHR